VPVLQINVLKLIFATDRFVEVEVESNFLLSIRTLWRQGANNRDGGFIGVVLESTGQRQCLENSKGPFRCRNARFLNLSDHEDPVSRDAGTLDGLDDNRHVSDIQYFQKPLFDCR